MSWRTRNYPRDRQVYFQWNCAFGPHRVARKRSGVMRTGCISTGLCGSSTDRRIIYWSYANFTAGPYGKKRNQKRIPPVRVFARGRAAPVRSPHGKRSGNTSRERWARECSRILCAPEVEFPNNKTPRDTRSPSEDDLWGKKEQANFVDEKFQFICHFAQFPKVDFWIIPI